MTHRRLDADVVACTLTGDEPAARINEFKDLFARALVGRERTPDALRFRFAAGADVEARVRELTQNESQCCSFYVFEVRRETDVVTCDVTVTSEAAAPMLDELYALSDGLASSSIV